MSNDIQKYRYLIETIILDESFKDAQVKFATTANPDEVKEYIDTFKELSKKNIIKGQEKDIGYWIKGDWDSFKKFVDSKKEVQSKSEVKSIQKKDSIRVYQDEEKIVVIPLTKEASIYYGKNTRWCTSATNSENYFAEYFYIKGTTLFYVLFKNGDKHACAFHPDHPDRTEYFDQLDNEITYNEFSNITGISEKDIQEWYSSNKGVIMKSQDIDNLDEEAQIEFVKQDASFIEHIDNPSEAVQLAAVKQNGIFIRYIYWNDITPSEAVQLAAVQQNGLAIELIDNPSEAVQLDAVKQNGRAIQYIKNPNDAVQLAALNRTVFAIRFIDNPSEQVQLAAVQKHGGAIEYLKNPTEKVKALHKKLWGNEL